ncbi:MAG: hypothetical protein ACOH1X_04375 [Kaistella sp.]
MEIPWFSKTMMATPATSADDKYKLAVDSLTYTALKWAWIGVRR